MKTLTEAFDAEMQQARVRYREMNLDHAMSHLATAHILGQSNLGRHWRVHAWMLRMGLAQRNSREVVGQVFRMALIPLGHLTRRLPAGNPGHSGVSAFRAMPVPPELKLLLDRELTRPQQ